MSDRYDRSYGDNNTERRSRSSSGRSRSSSGGSRQRSSDGYSGDRGSSQRRRSSTGGGSTSRRSSNSGRESSGRSRDGYERERDYERRPKNGRKRKMSRRQRKQRRHLIILLVFLILVLLGLIGTFGALKFFEYKTGESVMDCINDGKEIAANSKREDFLHGNITKIYAVEDSGGQTKEIASLSENNESSYLDYEDIPEDVVNAFVAVEDRTFWTNKGIDKKGIVRVLWTFVKSRGKTVNGASTITQQLVKLTYLSTEKTLSRKLKEIVIAKAITRKYSKEDIMEFYCNTCCFANGIYGIEDAAKKYFGVEPDQLTLSQCAYLCAIPNWPEHYNPRTNPENAIERRDKILKDMLEENYISQEEYDQAISEKIAVLGTSSETDSTTTAVETGKSTYNFETTYAVNCAVKYIMQLQEFEFRSSFTDDDDYESYQDSYEEAYAAAKHELYTGGYKIYTTIDLETQDKLQSILDDKLSDFTGKLDTGVYQVQGSMTVIDNETGKVVAVIGGRSQEETDGIYTLNRAYQGYQQPGSSIKPVVVYTPAMDTGEYNTASLLNNIDVSSAKTMSVSEIKEMTGTQIPLRNAVEQSLNGCAYWLFANIGVSTGMQYLSEMNYSRILPSDYNMSSCLGGLSYGVTTEEMANAYYTLENDGIYSDTDCISRIEDAEGNNIYRDPEEKRVYQEESARKMTDVMKGVLTNGTAARSYWYSYTSTEAAGKTGTTNDNKSAWFCGYTPYYTISVWVGCDTPVSLSGLSGASYPLAIWESSMLYLIQDKPTATFPEVEPDPEETPTEEEECTCILLCTDDCVDEDCPVCSKDHSLCEGQECTCSVRCEGDAVDESCPVCLQDMNLCQAEEMECTCTEKCTSDGINSKCPLCEKDYTKCQGTGEPEIIEPVTPQNPESGGDTGSDSTGEPAGGDGGGENSGGSTGGQSTDGENHETPSDADQPAATSLDGGVGLRFLRILMRNRAA